MMGMIQSAAVSLTTMPDPGSSLRQFSLQSWIYQVVSLNSPSYKVDLIYVWERQLHTDMLTRAEILAIKACCTESINVPNEIWEQGAA